MISNDDNIRCCISANPKNKEIDAEVTRNALISIAQELQRFQYETEESKENTNNDDQIFKDLKICTTKIKAKNKQLKKLKVNLKIACTVAKIVMSAKDRETGLLVDHLHIIRDESSNLLKIHTQNICLIEKLRTENINICNDVQRISNFLHLGYIEVQKMRNKLPIDIPLIMKLKEILIACGQYYADYCNDHERCGQLEQRNRFLKNKLNILENNLAACLEELQNLRNQNIRLTRSLDQMRMESLPKIQRNLKLCGPVPDVQIYCEKFGLTPKSVIDSQTMVRKSQVNVTSHLTAVNSLLHNQDSMLKDLKQLSEELCTPVL